MGHVQNPVIKNLFSELSLSNL